MNNFAAKVLEHISRFQMIQNGDKVLVAVSGGADSVCLLYLLVGLKEKLGIDLAIAHLNHSARGVDSDEDAQFVLNLGESMRITTFIEKIDISKEKKVLSTSFQDAGRIVRQKFLESTLDQIGGNKIALGHNADDQVETFLINLLRGSGLKGLGGMPEKNGVYIRPLLNCFKSDINKYLEAQALDHRFDKSNATKDYLRNRIRLDLIPKLQKDYNPNIQENLLSTINIIRDEDAFIADSIESKFQEISLPNQEKDEGLYLSVSDLLGYPLSIQRRLIRHAINLEKGDLKSYTYSHIQSIIKIMENGISGKEICLPSGLIAKLNDNYLKIYKSSGSRRSIITEQPERNITVPLNIPGDTWISGSPIKFACEMAASLDKDSFMSNSNSAYFDFDITGQKLFIRYPRTGDAFIPLGMSGSKKLKSFFIDTKTPREERKNIPILTTEANEIIWVYGKRISNNFKVTEKTKNILHIQGEECPG